MKVFTIGGATLDVFVRYEGTDLITITKKNSSFNFMLFESGEKIEVDELLYQTGGGATNSAVSFKRLGFDTSCFCNIGNDAAGTIVLDTLKKESVETKHIHTSTHYQTGTSFIVNSIKGDYTIFAFRGANSYLELEKLPFDHIAQAEQLYITSLSNNSSLLLPQLVEFAKKNNIRVAINPGVSQLVKGTQTLKESLKYIDILILNSSEAQNFMVALVANDEIYKKTLMSSQTNWACAVNMSDEKPYLIHQPLFYENMYFSIKKFFQEVLKMGPQIVVVTNGCNGVYVATHKEIMFYPSIKTKIINTVGAGDAFGSCFVASLMLGYSPEEALKNGIVNSASVLEHIGAKPGLLTHDQLKQRARCLDMHLLQRFTF
jgi:sugar/nucleoside kinase (ribokinase family)